MPEERSCKSQQLPKGELERENIMGSPPEKITHSESTSN